MAAPQDQIDALRRLIDDPDKTEFSDVDLGLILDGLSGDVNKAASESWSIKASRYSRLVDITESGSSRKLGDLYKNALAMKAIYDGKAEEGISTRGRTRIGRIVRRP